MWEKVIIKILNNDYKSRKNLKIITRKGSVEDIINILKYLKEINSNRKYSDIILIFKNILRNRIENVDDLFNTAMELKEIPDIRLDKILICSLETIPLPLVLKLSKALDQSFGMNIRDLLFKILFQEFSAENFSKLKLNGEYGLFDLICEYSFHSSSWISIYEQVLLAEIEKAKNAFRSHETFKILTNKILQNTNSCENIFCAQIFSQSLIKLSSLTIESCIVPTELKDVVEFLNDQNLPFRKEKIKLIGRKIGMSEDEIAELIEPPFEVLKRLMKNPHSDLKKIKNLIDKIKSELDLDKILELMTLALGVNNKEALAALGHHNLGLSLKAASLVEGKKGMEKLISTLTAGKGEDLITQWFIHRDEIPEFLKEKIKDLAKSILIDLGINYSRNYCGSLNSGLFQTNLVRPYEIGDCYEDIDLESTLFNILEKGKKIEHLTYDDFFVSINSNDKRTVCIEMDISESMTGKKLAYMAICVTMLVYGMKKDELGITLFEKNTHVLKEVNQKVELEELADELLSLKPRGTTFVRKALDWAKYQFKKSLSSKGKLNILFTDSDIFDLPDAAEILRAFKSLQVDFILVCPAKHNIEESEKIVKLAGGQLLKVEDWEKFPELITNIINSRF
ncbi:MAG: VWA domain-containing protein [Promethearchaeota archaeon]|nr:MAG: VWA domain-containing protein [Candidatus Lokiarchaeota archaeon]